MSPLDQRTASKHPSIRLNVRCVPRPDANSISLTHQPTQPSSMNPENLPSQRTAILTDSAAGMPMSLIAQLGVHVAPMTIRVGNEEIVDLPGTGYGSIYEGVQRNTDLSVTVSAPLPQVWRDAVVSIANESDTTSVLIITMSAHFSASYDAARVGATWATEQLPDLRVEVVDSGNFAGAQALVCTAAADAANAGADIEGATQAATDASSRVQSVTMLGTLAQINRVTRLPRFALATARNLPIKPVIRFNASGWKIVARPLTRRSGIGKVIAAAERGLSANESSAGNDTAATRGTARGRTTRVVVMHVQSKHDAQRVAGALAEAHPAADITVCEMHPFAGVPAGAGTVGVAWL